MTHNDLSHECFAMKNWIKTNKDFKVSSTPDICLIGVITMHLGFIIIWNYCFDIIISATKKSVSVSTLIARSEGRI